MEKGEYRPESPLSNAQAIRERFNPELDTFTDTDLTEKFEWVWPKWIFPKQRLARYQAEAAMKYINLIVKREYPYHIREYMGRHLWLEFCEYWAVNPDFDKAMRYL
jgi:hypothetical protein